MTGAMARQGGTERATRGEARGSERRDRGPWCDRVPGSTDDGPALTTKRRPDAKGRERPLDAGPLPPLLPQPPGYGHLQLR